MLDNRPRCTLCDDLLLGRPDDDVCPLCFALNLAGDPLRQPPRHWWLTARGERAPSPVPDGLRALTRALGWRWREDDGREDAP